MDSQNGIRSGVSNNSDMNIEGLTPLRSKNGLPKATRVRPSAFRKWMVTIQNPDPAEDFAKWMTERVEDVKFIVWSYEMGDKEIGESNPAYDVELHERGELQGGNLHYQVYFETTKQHRVAAMRKLIGDHWCEQCYAPRSAENYCCKADHTLIGGPWEFGKGSQQGERNDLHEVHKKIMEGETFRSLMKKGQNLHVLAKYPKFVSTLETIAESKEDGPEEWPFEFMGHTMEKPDPAVKKRHWWIHGPPDAGKTYGLELALGKRPVFYCKGNNKNRMEGYCDQNLIVFDDCVMHFEELAMYTDTHKYGLAIPARNIDLRLKRNSCRNVVVVSNSKIADIGFKNAAAVKARFIEIEFNPGFRED